MSNKLTFSLLLCVAFAAGSLARAGSAPAATPSIQNVHWIVSQTAIAKLRPSLGEDAVHRLFDNPNTYVIMNARMKPDLLSHAHHVLFYRDEALMESDLAAGKLDSVDGVLYDNEAYNEPGNTTPDVQKQDPVTYAQRAARALHAHGKLFVYTIGAATGEKGQFWNKTLPAVSSLPDVIDFQTQAAEGTERFAQQVRRYASVFKANGGKILLVGIGVSPKGQMKSVDDLESAYRMALSNNPPVDGFWFNMAIRSASCTGCAAEPDISPAVQFFQSLLH